MRARFLSGNTASADHPIAITEKHAPSIPPLIHVRQSPPKPYSSITANCPPVVKKLATAAHQQIRISRSPALSIALPNAFFGRVGLASVAAGHAA